MEKATAVNTCLGVLKGRDCIYLDQVKQDALNNLTFTGDINGHLVSQHRDEKDWFPYTLTFRQVLAYFTCELDTYENLAGTEYLDGSSFDLITMMFTTLLRFPMSLWQSCKCLKSGNGGNHRDERTHPHFRQSQKQGQAADGVRRMAGRAKSGHLHC